MDSWKICVLQCASLHRCSLNMTVLHHITAAKCDSGCLKIIMGVKPQFRGLHAHLT
jgi:hypothetical protein